jgi:hypothetical protein
LVLGYFLNMGHLGPSLSFYQFDASKYLEPVQSLHYLKNQVPTKAGSGTLRQVMRTWKLVGSFANGVDISVHTPFLGTCLD